MIIAKLPLFSFPQKEGLRSTNITYISLDLFKQKPTLWGKKVRKKNNSPGFSKSR
jgi:hypothetical protein